MKSDGGLRLITILQIVFILLKLFNQITWSWWVVTAPLWGSFVLIFIMTMLIIIFKK